MPHKRDWLAGLQCLFAVIPDAPRDGWPEALGLTIRSWKTDTPHVLARERRTFEGEDEAARVYALRLSLATCADAIKAARILAARKLVCSLFLLKLAALRLMLLAHAAERCTARFRPPDGGPSFSSPLT